MEAVGNVDAITRAQYILSIRSDGENVPEISPSTPSPYPKRSKGSPYQKAQTHYSFEDDLSHHIREAFVILSTGTPVSFFTNPYVIDWLKGLNQAHRPIHRLKFLRLLRVI